MLFAARQCQGMVKASQGERFYTCGGGSSVSPQCKWWALTKSCRG